MSPAGNNRIFKECLLLLKMELKVKLGDTSGNTPEGITGITLDRYLRSLLRRSTVFFEVFCAVLKVLTERDIRDIVPQQFTSLSRGGTRALKWLH